MSDNYTLTAMQKEVDQYIQQFKSGYFTPLAQMARLTEEVGELVREVNHYYTKSKKAFGSTEYCRRRIGRYIICYNDYGKFIRC